MSIVLKSNELNTLIYKYLLEAGLSHTAYTLFNQAALSQPLQEYRFDVRSGHLLSILEKGLIYAKIQAHVNFSEYMDCNQPFYLLKSHTCKVTEKVKKERSQAVHQLQEQINEGIRRTNSVYNTAIANRDFEEIVYEAKGKKYFQKFAKIRLPTNDSDNQNTSGKYILGGTDVFTLLYNSENCEMDLLKYDSINESVTLQRILPSVKLGELVKSIDESITNQQIIQLFDGNHVTLFDLKNEESDPIEFTIPVQSQLTKIEPNPHISQLVCFKNQQIYLVINMNSFKVVARGEGELYWRSFDEYILVNNNNLHLYSLQAQEPLQTFQSEVYLEIRQIQWQEIRFNSARNLFATVSYSNRTIHVYTLESSKPLFIFSFQDKILRQAMFITSNSVDYLCWFTNQSIKIFDLSLNAYSKVIQIAEYDTQIQQICALQKADKDQMYLLALGTENLLVYDIGNSKIERVQVEGKFLQLKQLSPSRVGMVTDSNIYFLVGQYIDLLFK